MSTWTPYDVETDGQAEWLTRLFEKTVRGIRSVGMPKASDNKIMAIEVPTLYTLAHSQRPQSDAPPGSNTPTAVVFID